MYTTLADVSSFMGSLFFAGLCACVAFGAGWFLRGKYGSR